MAKANWTKNIRTVAGAAILALFWSFLSSPAHAALEAVSGFVADNTELRPVRQPAGAANVAYSLANGFPIWYEDENGLRLELCLDRNVEINPGVFIDPCFIEALLTIPVSFPNNFGNEAFWWATETFGTFQSSQNGVQVAGGDALLVMALEAAFGGNLGVLDGDQTVFGRIRLRVSVPVAGTYRVTHPFGTMDYVVTDPARRSINQTQDLGNFLLTGPPPAGDFTVALFDGVAVPSPADPSVNAGAVNQDGRTIGPFLRPVANNIVSLDGRQFIANPGTELAPILQPIINGPFGNTLTITLLNPPAGFSLNVNGTQTVEFANFQVMGKVFNDGPNIRPASLPDLAGTSRNTPVRIDVAVNDLDLVTGDNVHGLNPQALGLPVQQSATADLRQGILLTQPLTTAQGGTVRRSTTLSTGETVLVYTPPNDFVGQDTFFYVIQDTGGLISEPSQVTVTIEDLAVDAASYRSRIGKWSVSGTSSDPTDNFVNLSLGPRAALSGAGEVPPVAGTGALGNVGLILGVSSIQFELQVDPQPISTVTQAHIHVGGPGENGPAIFVLYNNAIEAPFTGSKAGTLTPLNLIASPAQGIGTFGDAVTAIREGRAYVNVHTVSNPNGEIRGQLGFVPLGTAQVGPEGRWTFQGKSAASPGGSLRNVNLESANGVRVLGVPIKMR